MPDQPDTSPSPERPPDAAPEPSGSPAPGGPRGPEPKRRHRAIVWSLIVLASVVLVLLDHRELGSARGARHEAGRGHDRPDRQGRGRTAGARHLHGRSALRQRRCPGRDREEAAGCRSAARGSGRSGDEATRHERGREGARLASGSEPRLHRGRSGARAVRQPDRGRGGVRLDHGRGRHARIRERRRRPCRPPRGGPSDDLPDPGRRAGVLGGPAAAVDHGSDPDRVSASNPLPGASGRAEPGGATESPGPQQDRRRAPGDGREPREEDQGRSGKGPRPAPGPVVRPRGPAVRRRRPAGRAEATDRRRAQGSQPGERRNARCLARLAPATDHHSARAPGRADPR